MSPTNTWQYHPASDFGLSWLQRLRRFPRSPDMTAWGIRSLSMAVVRAYLKAFHRLAIEGAAIKSLKIHDLTVTRLHAVEVTVSETFRVPEQAAGLKLPN